MRRLRILGALAAALVGAAAAPAQSAVLLYENFGGGHGERAESVAKSTPWGGGWRANRGGDVPENADLLTYPAAGNIRPEQGTIEIEVVRDEYARDELESFLSLVDASGETLLTIRMLWSTPPVLEISGHGIRLQREEGDRLFGGSFYSGAELPQLGRGSRTHIAFSWGPSPEQTGAYVDGRPVAAAFDNPGALPGIIARAVSIAVGGHPKPGGGAQSLTHSPVTAFYIYDTPISGADLQSSPGQYHPPAPRATVASVSHDAGRVAGFSGRLVAGNTLSVTVEGTPGVPGTFDVVHYPDFGRSISLDWSGWGVYLEEKTFYDRGEVNLREVEGYDVHAATEPFDPMAPGFDPVEQLAVEQQQYLLEDLEIDTPYYVAVTARMRDGSRRGVILPVAGRALTESAPGVYTGTWSVGYADRFPRAVVVGRLGAGQRAASLAGADTIATDPALRISVATSPEVLRADERSRSEVSVEVTDANGNPVSGRTIRFLLATTSQYTGVVGGGAFAEQVGGTLSELAFGETDLFGRLTATYVAGFAAKTAVIVARDMESNDTGAGSVQTYITASADIQLEPVADALAAEGYELTVTSSDQWLTADGRSTARITARLTLRGQPVEGERISFGVGPGMGSVRVVRGTTDSGGEARAVYTAGTRIGIAVITASADALGVTGSVPIELRSDAPAKIVLRVEPETLPADGRSRADISVLVTDINDNPNDNTTVEYEIVAGDGSLRESETVTDRRGETGNVYTAGRTPGRTTIELTVRSMVPTAEELAAARALAVAVTDYRFF